MKIEEFWAIIDKVKDSSEPEVDVKELLERLSPEELTSYQEHFDILHENAYRWNLWGAAYIMNGGCSDDGFMDFRYGLISKGKGIYENALVDPDSLAKIGTEVELSNELFGYVAGEVYEEKTGSEIPTKEYEQPDDPIGEEWDFDDIAENKKRLPKLSALYEE